MQDKSSTKHAAAPSTSRKRQDSFWTESRTQFRPRGSRLIAYELSQRGVDRATVRAAADSVDDADSAYRAGLKWASRLSTVEELTYRRRLGDFLSRRGFDHETTSQAVDRIWREATTVA